MHSLGFDNAAAARTPARKLTRRRAVRLIGAGLGLALLGGCDDDGNKWHAIDVSGSSPPLAFTMERALRRQAR